MIKINKPSEPRTCATCRYANHDHPTIQGTSLYYTHTACELKLYVDTETRFTRPVKIRSSATEFICFMLKTSVCAFYRPIIKINKE